MKKRATRKKPGPKAETLKIDGVWTDAVRGALKRGPYSRPTSNNPPKKRGKRKPR
jgi:hypothetical protein